MFGGYLRVSKAVKSFVWDIISKLWGGTINSAYMESAEPLTKANSRDDVLLYVAPNAGKINFGGHP